MKRSLGERSDFRRTVCAICRRARLFHGHHFILIIEAAFPANLEPGARKIALVSVDLISLVVSRADYKWNDDETAIVASLLNLLRTVVLCGVEKTRIAEEQHDPHLLAMDVLVGTDVFAQRR